MANDPNDVSKLVRSTKRRTERLIDATNQIEMELVRFTSGDQSIPFNIDISEDTVWATQAQMAALYERNPRTISEHIQAILNEDELDASSVVRKFRVTASDGKSYETAHYDLDMILAVGFRVKSPRATEFRKWAYKTLRSYIVDGYAINEARLRDDPAATNALASKLREIRAQEKNLYASVRAYFKEAATDYDPKSQASRSFYARLQDRFHYAITEKTASQIILSRADHKRSAMGLVAYEGNMPTIDEAQVAKNYLESDELYTLHLLCEQFLLYIESKAMRGQKMTMEQLATKLDELLAVNDYPVFPGYKDFLKDKAVKHAQVEYARFAMRLKHDDVQPVGRARAQSTPASC